MLYCVCKQPENGSHMLCCDYCDMWYHFNCVGLPVDLKHDKVKYKCIGCALREGKLQCYGSLNEEQKKANLTEKPNIIDFGEGLPMDQNQQEIERILLDFFITKQRIPYSQFQFVIHEGRNNIPLNLEEMEYLDYIDQKILQWKLNAASEINKGIDLVDLVTNFKFINFRES